MVKADPLVVGVEYLSTYVDASFGRGKKSLAFRLIFRGANRTLKTEEVEVVLQKIIKKLEKNFAAQLR